MTIVRILSLWVIATAVFFSLPFIIPGFHVYSWSAAAVAAILLGVLNAVASPILVFVTGIRHAVVFAIAILLFNVVLMGFVGKMTAGVTIDGKTAAASAALLMTLAMTASHYFIDQREI